MKLRRQPCAPRACLFVVLFGVLASCSNVEQEAAQGPTSVPVPTLAADTAPTLTFATTPALDTQQNIQTAAAAPGSQIPSEAAIGDVVVVPYTESTPVTGGGETGVVAPSIEPAVGAPVAGKTRSPPTRESAETENVRPPAVPSTAKPVVAAPIILQPRMARFSEVAPDTTGGATFQASEALSYDLGNLVAATGGNVSTFSDDTIIIAPVKGWLRYPQAALDPTAPAPSRYPIIVFLHGQHDANAPNYQGYDYMAKDLASHGYVVLSIDANRINGDASGGDPGSQSRAQLVLGTLDRLRQIDARGQVDKDGNPGLLAPLKGKLDFKRIGIMGHSRGGQGISNTVKFNATRHSIGIDDLTAALKNPSPALAAAYPDLVAAVLPKPITTFDAFMARVKLDWGIFADYVTPESIEENFGLTPTSSSAAIAEAALESYGDPITNPAVLAAALIDRNIFFAAGSETTPPYYFKGAFMLAPTDFDGNLAINNVPLAVLLPSCDGDVNDLQGARTFDHNRFGPDTDGAPRYQILVKGTNHNFYNTVWTGDDHANWDRMGVDNYCNAGRKDSIRLTAEDQRRGGNFVISSFMRYHVGGEQKFAAYWNGTAQLPPAACPSGTDTCDTRVLLSIQKGDTRRKVIQRFDADDSISTNLLGGAFVLKDFDVTARCDMPYGAYRTGGNCTPSRLQDFEYTLGSYFSPARGLMSIAEHAELVWTKPNASVTTDLGGSSAAGYDYLTFRIAVVRPFGQEVEVTLTDTAGHEAKIPASDYSDALYNAPRPRAEGMPMVDDNSDTPFNDGQVRELLNMVAIPLKAFQGIDTTKLKQLKLSFPRESGKIAITDIELQNFGRDKPQSTVALN
ncbi:hypothetical protein [Rhizobium tubonense]|uniref:hypothetical protein n=1 Tax=Rhizobium tubonense TaxID=484088 RepID=UPI0019D4AD00|nr:hypothetical protein [Rhizobium tubonense]